MPKKRKITHTIGGEHGATCRDLLSLLNQYVEGNVDPSVCKDLEAHLKGCNPCRVVVDNIRKTITLYKKEQPRQLPAKFRSKLHIALRNCWKKDGPGRKRPKRA